MLSVTKAPHPKQLVWPSDAIAAALSDKGWWCGVPPLDADQLNTLQLASIDTLAENSYRPGVGRQLNHRIDTELRGDHIAWLERGCHGAFDLWLDQLNMLSHDLRLLLRLPLRSIEAMCACYPPGTAYGRHIDQHRELNARLLSCALYLNPKWQAGDGGELSLWTNSQAAEPQPLIEPRFGTFILFRSDMPHAVHTAHKPRYSITSWLRRDEQV